MKGKTCSQRAGWGESPGCSPCSCFVSDSSGKSAIARSWSCLTSRHHDGCPWLTERGIQDWDVHIVTRKFQPKFQKFVTNFLRNVFLYNKIWINPQLRSKKSEVCSLPDPFALNIQQGFKPTKTAATSKEWISLGLSKLESHFRFLIVLLTA